VALGKSNRYEDAIMSYEQALQIKSDDDSSWNNRGCALGNLGRYEEAIASYEQALQIKPDFHEAWFNRGISLNNLGQYELAITSYEQVLQIKPDYYEAWSKRGTSLANLGQYEAATASYDQALQIKPDDHEAWSKRGTSLANLGQYEAAIASYDQALQIKPDTHEAWSNRGVCLDNLGRFQEAIVSLEMALELNPYSAENWHVHAITLEHDGRYEEAIKSYCKALETNPEIAHVWYGLAISMKNLGNHVESINAYDRAVEIQPDFPTAWTNRGIVLNQLGRCEEAILSFENALNTPSHFPEIYNAWNNRGVSFLYLKYYEDSIYSCDQALYYKPDFYSAWGNRSNAAFWGSEQSQHQDTFLTLKHPELNQRGYQGRLASLTVGLTYCLAPIAQGFLQELIGDAHWDHAPTQSNPRYYRNIARAAYETSLRHFTASDHPEERLQTLQKLLRTHDILRDITPAATQALLRQATELRTHILDSARSDEQRERLTRTLPNFNELTVDFHLSQGDNIVALETAEADKNSLMQWLISGTANYAQMREMLTPDCAIVYWYLSANAITSFILRHDQLEPIVVTEFDREISLKARDRLDEWIKNWNKNYNPKSKDTDSDWQDTLETELETLAEILEITKLLPHLQNIQTLILVPHRDLHRFPLHSFLPQSNITYLPSLHLGRKLPAAPDTDPTILMIEAPDHDGMEPLPHATAESIGLHRLYPNHLHLSPDQASPEVFLQAIGQPHTHLHFNGHANHNATDPKRSQLALTGSATLTLQEFINHPCRTTHLVTLAACETGITNAQTITSEYVGWVSACLGRGIPHVLSTLWTVQSDATALFMLHFYRQLLQHQSPILAHQQAQQWLRTLTVRDLRQFYTTELSLSDNNHLEEFLETEQYKLSKMEASDQPYVHPYYWAAFILSGRPNHL
jgi:tetratricopeptide (TPR) repeat protein